MMNYPNYSFNQYNPMFTAQQRLNQMEAQYPQYTQPAGFKTLQVSNIDEANATPADMTGNPIFFFNKAKGEVYLKQLNLQNGEAYFQTFKLVQTPTENKPVEVNISEEQYKVLSEKLDAVYSLLSTKEEPKREARGNAK